MTYVRPGDESAQREIGAANTPWMLEDEIRSLRSSKDVFEYILAKAAEVGKPEPKDVVDDLNSVLAHLEWAERLAGQLGTTDVSMECP